MSKIRTIWKLIWAKNHFVVILNGTKLHNNIHVKDAAFLEAVDVCLSKMYDTIECEIALIEAKDILK